MYAQLLLDIVIASAIIYFLWQGIKKTWMIGETPVTLELKKKELHEQRKRLEELEKEVETTKSLVEVRRKLDLINKQIAAYDAMIKRKGAK